MKLVHMVQQVRIRHVSGIPHNTEKSCVGRPGGLITYISSPPAALAMPGKADSASTSLAEARMDASPYGQNAAGSKRDKETATQRQRPCSAYFLFSNENRYSEDVTERAREIAAQSDCEKVDQRHRAKAMGEMWKAMGVDARQPYVQESERRRGPRPPKGKKTSYNFFSSKRMAEIKEEDAPMTKAGINRLISKEWKESSDEMRAPFVRMADEDKERYQREVEEYVAKYGPLPKKAKAKTKAKTKAARTRTGKGGGCAENTQGSGNKQEKKEEASTAAFSFSVEKAIPPKRPPTAYMCFVRDRTPYEGVDNPDMSKAQIRRMLNQKWKDMDTSERKPFVDEYKELKIQYTQALYAYSKARKELEDCGESTPRDDSDESERSKPCGDSNQGGSGEEGGEEENGEEEDGEEEDGEDEDEEEEGEEEEDEESSGEE